MITNPVNVVELSAIVVLHPSQLNNELYNNLKENLSVRILGRCYKDYGIINKIFEIKEYSGAQIFNEDIEAKVQYNVKFTCEVIKPVDGTTIITKINTNNKLCLTTENYSIITFIEPSNISDNYYINQYTSKIVYKKTNEELKKGDLVKVKIIQSLICNNKTKIVSTGFIEDNLTEDEIKEYYDNMYDEEFEKPKKDEILLSRISNDPGLIEDKEFKFDRTLTNLMRFKTKKEIVKTNNKIIVLNNLADLVDIIYFLSPFVEMKDAVCICIKKFINEKNKTLLMGMFKNIQFKFFQYYLKHEIKKYEGKKILLICDEYLSSEILDNIKPIKVDLPFNIDKIKEDKGKYFDGDIIIPPYTNQLRIYTKAQDEKKYNIEECEHAFKNYITNFNNPDKVYNKYLDLFKEFDIEPTFNNIVLYKILRFYNKNVKTKISKKETLKTVFTILKYYNN